MSAPVWRTLSGIIAFTVAAVPTGMKAGVRISPLGVEMTPVRAAPSVAFREKEKLMAQPIASNGAPRNRHGLTGGHCIDNSRYMEQTDAITAFAALAQPTRLDAFRLLVKAGPDGMAAGEIADALGARQNTMSANLSVLHAAGLVESRREGRSIRYFAAMGRVGALVDFLVEDCCGGRPDLCPPVGDCA